MVKFIRKCAVTLLALSKLEKPIFQVGGNQKFEKTRIKQFHICMFRCKIAGDG